MWIPGGARMLSALISVFTLGGALMTAADASEMRGFKVGQTFTYKLEGNPSTGYVWRVSTTASENTALLKIEDLGSSNPTPDKDKHPLLGAPEEHAFRITTVAPGLAKVVFEYVRPWIGKAEKVETLTVEVVGD